MEEDVTGEVDIDALGLVVDAGVDAGASMGVTAAGDPVLDDAGVNVGARVNASLGATSEYVTFLNALKSQK